MPLSRFKTPHPVVIQNVVINTPEHQRSMYKSRLRSGLAACGIESETKEWGLESHVSLLDLANRTDY